MSASTPLSPRLQHARPGHRHWLALLRHARRCFRRVGYWLRQFRQEAPVWRCSAWRSLPPASTTPAEHAGHGKPPPA